MTYAKSNARIRKNALSTGAASSTQIFHVCCWLYLVAFFLLPEGCGFRLGILWSAKRIMFLVCYAMIFANRERLTKFWHDVKKCIIPNIFIAVYLFIRLYTSIYRMSDSITGEVLDLVLVFYLFVYILKHEISPEKLIRFIRVALAILCVEGIWEASTGINLFGFLNWAGEAGWGVYVTRGGILSRIMGNCHSAITFGFYLSILFFLSCVNTEENKLYLFRSPLLFILTSVCVFLTGSRAPLGIYIMCVFLICLFSNKDERIKSLIILFFSVSVFALFTMIVYRTGTGRQIMLMLTNMWDVLFDTRYADNWGGTAINSTEYREALAKVFDLDYFNKFIGRGASYRFSVVIDGYWLRSCDNSYVMAYITLAYPGMFSLIGHGLIMLGYCIRGAWRQKKAIFAAAAISAICYFINIWYVASMGTYMYMWMLFALIYVCYKNETFNTKKEETI